MIKEVSYSEVAHATFYTHKAGVLPCLCAIAGINWERLTTNSVVNLLDILCAFIVTLKLFECQKNLKAKQKTKTAR